MINFWIHLRKAITEGRLCLGKNKLGDWFNLLDNSQLERLNTLMKDFPNDTNYIEDINFLVYSLCLLEGIDLEQNKSRDLVQAVQRFVFMLRLETLKRQQRLEPQKPFSFLVDPHAFISSSISHLPY